MGVFINTEGETFTIGKEEIILKVDTRNPKDIINLIGLIYPQFKGKVYYSEKHKSLQAVFGCDTDFYYDSIHKVIVIN